MEKNPFEAPKTPLEKEAKTSDESINELINEDRDLRAEFFKLRERLEEEKDMPQEEKKEIKQRLKEINEKCKPISRELDSKSGGLYSEVMDIPVKKQKGIKEEAWKKKIKKSGEALKGAKEKLGKMEDIDPSIKIYLEERIKQKGEQLFLTEAPPSKKIPKEGAAEEIVEKEPKKERIVSAKEQILIEARRKFALVDIRAEKELKKKKIKSKEKIEGYKESKEEYLKALQEKRGEMYEKALEEIEKLGLPEKEADEKMKEKMEEIIKTTVVREANELYDLKTDLQLEVKKTDPKIEKMKKLAGTVVEKYRRMPTRYKLLISAGLFGGAWVAGAIGGATGAALATGVVTGRWFQRVLGGAATAVGLEALIQKIQEKRAEKKTLKEFSGGLKDLLEKDNDSLDKKLLKLEGSKKKEKYWRYTIAGSAGVLIASGIFGKAISRAGGEVWEKIKDTPIGKGLTEAWEKIKGAHVGPGAQPPTEGLSAPHPEAPYAPEPAHEVPAGPPRYAGGIRMPTETASDIPSEPGAEAPPSLGPKYAGGVRFPTETPSDIPSEAPPYIWEIPSAPEPPGTYVSDIETVQKGDDLWKIIDRQLDGRYSHFDELSQAQKTYIIDDIKDKIAQDQTKYGLTNIDHIVPGQQIDISDVVGNQNVVDNSFDHAETLQQFQIDNINHHEQILDNWVAQHPGQALTSEKVEEILRGKISGIIPEPVVPETPLPGPEIASFEPLKPEITGPGPEHFLVSPPEHLLTTIDTIKTLGFNLEEYRAIESLKVEKLLEQIPSKAQAWELWRHGEVKLPHSGWYGVSEFNKHIKLAEFIRSFRPGEHVKKMTVSQFLKTLGPKELVI